MARSTLTPPQPKAGVKGRDKTRKPREEPEGPRVDPVDPVEEASYESFPASDPPAFMSPARTVPGRRHKPRKR